MNICFTICSLSNSGGTERVSSIIANVLSKKYNKYNNNDIIGSQLLFLYSICDYIKMCFNGCKNK